MNQDTVFFLGFIIMAGCVVAAIPAYLAWRRAERAARPHLRAGKAAPSRRTLNPDLYSAQAYPHLREGWRARRWIGAAFAGMGATALLLKVGPSLPVALLMLLAGLFVVVQGQRQLAKIDRLTA